MTENGRGLVINERLKAVVSIGDEGSSLILNAHKRSAVFSKTELGYAGEWHWFLIVNVGATYILAIC